MARLTESVITKILPMKLTDYPIKQLKPEEPLYPRVLRKIKNAPKILYYRGKLNPKIFEKSLAVVGSRRISQYGKKVVELLIPALVGDGITIISGFMFGVDTAAHQECLDVGGVTVAVLGGGLNVMYPPENEKLYHDILKKGGVIFSEYLPETQPQLWTFPQRNRIVAGLSTLGVLIIEAGEKSGSLITAKLAIEQGKKVYAVPGPVTSSVSAGANLLIQGGQAKMVLAPEDILGKRRIASSNKALPAGLGLIEQKIITALSAEALTVDEIARVAGQGIAETGQTLTLMSLRGLISEANGKYYLDN